MKEIYIAKKHRKENYKEFIKYLLSQKQFPCTYHDKKMKNVQCKTGKSRSVGDITKLVQTYFKVSEKQVFKCIYYTILDNNLNKHIIFCNNINKLTVHNGRFYNSTIFKICYDYQNYFKKGYQIKNIVDHITLEYFLRKVGFTQKEIDSEMV